MNKLLASVAVAVVVGVGLGFLFDSPKVVERVVEREAPVGSRRIADDHFVNGFYAGSTDQFSVSSTGVLSSSGGITTTGALTGTTFASGSVGASSSTPAALGSAASGHFIIATGGNTGQASTTAVTANSTIILQREGSTPIAGTTCNTTATTTPIVTSKVAGNGFIATSAANPVTNPICLAYWIIN